MADRGQTAIDYAVGVGVFLIAVALVFGFLPGLNRPTPDAGQNRLADRAITTIGTDKLGGPDQLWELDDTCTEHFFNETRPPSDDNCQFDRQITVTNRTRNNLSTVLGIPNATFANVTIERDGATAPLNVTGNVTMLRTGRPIPESGVRVAVSRRTVLVNGSRHRLLVRVW